MNQTTPIAPRTIRYIKLGAGGSFARSSLDKGELQLGYHEVPTTSAPPGTGTAF